LPEDIADALVEEWFSTGDIGWSKSRVFGSTPLATNVCCSSQ
jgi:hypothetical protein